MSSRVSPTVVNMLSFILIFFHEPPTHQQGSSTRKHRVKLSEQHGDGPVSLIWLICSPSQN